MVHAALLLLMLEAAHRGPRFHNQPEAQHPKSPAIHKLAGRLPIYVKRHENDAVDAEAICEAVTRTNMRFVATKTPEQQSCLTLHRTHHLFIRQQTSVINAILTSGCRVLP